MSRSIVTAAALTVGFASGCIIVDGDEPYLHVYEPCARDWQCEYPADGCYSISVDYGSRVVTDGMCTLDCYDDRDCPFGGACYEVQAGPPICYQRCVYDSECPPGFRCLDTIWGWVGDAICLPW